MSRSIWNAPDAEIVRRYASGESLRRIGMAYGKDKASVRWVLRRNRVALRDATEMRRMGGLLTGPVNGRNAVASGQFAAASKESLTSERANRARRDNGKRAAESGQLDRARTCYPRTEAQRENGRRLGMVYGPMRKASGELGRGLYCVTTDGFMVRSTDEAVFYEVAKELGGRPSYEPESVVLPDGRSYTYDFVLGASVLGIPSGVPIELKPTRDWWGNGSDANREKFEMFRCLRPEAVAVFSKEMWA